MAFPSYDKNKRKKPFRMLPVGAYVIKIIDAKEEANKSGRGSHLTIAFDIAEGEHKGFYMNMWNDFTSEDKKWPRDGVMYLVVPYDGAHEMVWQNWNTFFANLEDSNNGFVFDTNKGDLKTLIGKLVGGKFRLEQNEYKGNIYDHVKLAETCTAEDVRSGNYGTMPKDKKVAQSAGPTDEFLTIPDSVMDEVPFL